MKYCLLAVSILLSTVAMSAARAGDLVPATWLPASDSEVGAIKWSGFYFTPYFGYETLKLNGAGRAGLKNPQGWRLGAEAGYDWQFDQVVLGVAAEGEDIDTLELSIDEAMAMVDDGRIVDGKTILLLQHACLKIFR